MSNADWKGNSTALFSIMTSSSHSDTEREKNDFYSTDPKTLEIFLDALKRDN